MLVSQSLIIGHSLHHLFAENFVSFK